MKEKTKLFLNKLLNKLIFKLNDTPDNPNPDLFDDLAPINDVEDNKYLDGLRWALKNDKIKNIAVTGPLGSGKSSILNTFQEIHQEYKYLKISLASFTEDLTAKEDMNRLIERSIIQQIFYGEEHARIPDSRFKRIKSLSFIKMLSFSVSTIIWLVSTMIIFYPNLFDAISLLKELIQNKSLILDYLFLVIFFAGMIKMVMLFLRVINNSKLNKLNIQSGEIELNKGIDSSILNKYFDELLYFFEVRDYNVVIFEDLDRFNSHDIFPKLREINLLINKADQIGRRIVFIYAVKDDLFIDKNNRTKFFDFIIPIIPVINSSNSGELLWEKIKVAQLSKLLTKEYISDISLYIDDMRIMKNIYNEFIFYNGKLGSINLFHEKLFSLIIYKNLFPNDFAELHEKKGMIYDFFSKKGEVVAHLCKSLDDKIPQIQEKIDSANNENLNSISELRFVYIAKFLTLLSDSNVIIGISNVGISIDKLINDENFYKLTQQSNIQYQKPRYGFENSGISFNTLENAVNSKMTYNEREKNIRLKELNKIEKLKKELKDISNGKKLIESLDLYQLLPKINNSFKFIETIRKEAVLFYLVSHGYIDEEYESYTSYFYEGSLTREDKNFVLSIKDLRPLEFSYKLFKIEEVIKKIRLSEFSKYEALNFDLIDFLIQNSIRYKNELNAIYTQLKDESVKSISFIDEYIINDRRVDSFINLLCKNWYGVWEYVEIESNYSEEKRTKYFELIIEHANVKDIKEIFRDFKENISGNRKFLAVSNNTDKLKTIITELEIDFKNIDFNNSSEEMLRFIYEYNHYQFNAEMLASLMTQFGKFNKEIFESSNYYSIKQSECTNLIEFVDSNINEYIVDMYLEIETNTREKETSFIELLNHNDLTFENKQLIIKQTVSKISDLSLIENSKLLSELLIDNVYPEWDNLLFFYNNSGEVISELIVEYINILENAKELSKVKIPTKVEGKNIFGVFCKELIQQDEISDTSYRLITISIPGWYSDLHIVDLSTEKVHALIDNLVLAPTNESFVLLKENFEGLNIKILEKHKNKYFEIIDKLIFDGDDLELLLKSKILTNSEKNILLNKCTDATISSNSENLKLISKLLLKDKNFIINVELIRGILIDKNIMIEERIKIFNKSLITIDENFITDFLNSLDDNYAKIANKNKRAKIADNKHNREFLTILDNINYISSISAGKFGLQVNHYGK